MKQQIIGILKTGAVVTHGKLWQRGRECRRLFGRICRSKPPCRTTAQIVGSPVRYGSTGTSAGTDTRGTALDAAAASHSSPPSLRRVEPSPRVETRP